MSTSSTERETGGYDYQFVHPLPDRLVCVICHFPCRDSHLSVCCGHNYCKSCLDVVKRAGVTHACPVCNNKEFQTFPNRQADREVRSLHVFCINNTRGCEWQGELNDINNHLENSDGCQFKVMRCPNKCGKIFQRQYLTSHVQTECPHRKVYCTYCKFQGEYHYIVGKHATECPKEAIPYLSCIPLENVRAHRNECPLEMVQCEYRDVGCEVLVPCKNLVVHEKEFMEKHLSLTIHHARWQQQYIFDLESQMKVAKHELASTKKQFEEAVNLMKHLSSDLRATKNNLKILKAQLQRKDEELTANNKKTVSTKPPAKTAGSAKGRLFDDSEEEDLFLSPATELMTNSSVIDDAEIMHSSDSNFITSADTTIPVVASSLTNPVTSKVPLKNKRTWRPLFDSSESDDDSPTINTKKASTTPNTTKDEANTRLGGLFEQSDYDDKEDEILFSIRPSKQSIAKQPDKASNPLFSDSSQSDDDDDAYKLIAMPQADYNFMAVVQGVQQAKVTDPLSENEDLLGENLL
ncbi:TNF receptor-associated factor 6-like isoform X2 [Dysidea avara]|uniref:TNF receptor-associated factor 6-like isoform X2 n=1 Tax=Dysidea avara TaxID=196820 RepID=UPI00331EE2CF